MTTSTVKMWYILSDVSSFYEKIHEDFLSPQSRLAAKEAQEKPNNWSVFFQIKRSVLAYLRSLLAASTKEKDICRIAKKLKLGISFWKLIFIRILFTVTVIRKMWNIPSN